MLPERRPDLYCPLAALARHAPRDVSVAALPLARSTATAVLSMLFQPIIDLDSEAVIGYEALARGPVGSPWEQPQELFAQARIEGRLREMDWACRVAAVRDVRACSTELPHWRLFVNTEPEVLGTICPEELLADWVGGTGELEIVVEVTERALVHGPRRLIAAVEELRQLGCEIALDDVGSNAASVALLPLLEPDVVKLDAALLRPSSQSAETLATLRAVTSYVDRSGAVVVAEGIESAQDRTRALALGAQWGQGYLFAHPRELRSRDVVLPAAKPIQRAAQRPGLPVPERRDSGVPKIVAAREWVTEHLRTIAESARSDAAMNVVLMRLPDPSLAPGGFFELLEELHEVCALSVVVLGQGRSASAVPASTVQDPEAVVAVVLGPSIAHSMDARKGEDGRYVVVLSDCGADVAAAARAFLALRA